MLVKVDRPYSTATTIVVKSSSKQHQIGGLAGDIGAGPAHGHTDVGLVKGGTVVDAVPGHRHT